MFYVFDFTIDVKSHLIKHQDNTIHLRPKTFSLLIAFLESPSRLLTKQVLIDKVWDDVLVDDQVLVQSVREIRQVFGDNKVIQTHPRKGYSWVAAIHQTSDINDVIKKKSEKYLKLVVVIFLLLFLIGSLAFQQANKDATQGNETDIVLVLPVKNNIP